jgi:hypothetical protein
LVISIARMVSVIDYVSSVNLICRTIGTVFGTHNAN